MGTENENEEVEETEESDLIKDLRKQIKTKDKELKDLRPLKTSNVYLKAGLDELTEEKKIALAAVVGTDVDLTPDLLKEKAKLLGFVSDDGGVPAEQNGTSTEDAQVQQEVAEIHKGEQTVASRTTKPDNRDFATRLGDAKSQEEIMDLIREQGEGIGLLVDDST